MIRPSIPICELSLPPEWTPINRIFFEQCLHDSNEQINQPKEKMKGKRKMKRNRVVSQYDCQEQMPDQQNLVDEYEKKRKKVERNRVISQYDCQEQMHDQQNLLNEYEVRSGKKKFDDTYHSHSGPNIPKKEIMEPPQSVVQSKKYSSNKTKPPDEWKMHESGEATSEDYDNNDTSTDYDSSDHDISVGYGESTNIYRDVSYDYDTYNDSDAEDLYDESNSSDSDTYSDSDYEVSRKKRLKKKIKKGAKKKVKSLPEVPKLKKKKEAPQKGAKKNVKSLPEISQMSEYEKMIQRNIQEKNDVINFIKNMEAEEVKVYKETVYPNQDEAKSIVKRRIPLITVDHNGFSEKVKKCTMSKVDTTIEKNDENFDKNANSTLEIQGELPNKVKLKKTHSKQQLNYVYFT